MAKFPTSERLQKLFDEMSESQKEDVMDESDMTCTTGYDNDGSTGYEIFENGFDLAVRAAGKSVFKITWSDQNAMLFFIGTEEHVLETLQRVAKENPPRGG